MFIGINDIKRLLRDYRVEYRCTDDALCLTGFLPLDSAPVPYAKHILYLVEEPFDQEQMAPNMPETLAIIRESDAAGVRMRLQEYFMRHTADALLSEASSTVNVNEPSTCSAMYFKVEKPRAFFSRSR